MHKSLQQNISQHAFDDAIVQATNLSPTRQAGGELSNLSSAGVILQPQRSKTCVSLFWLAQ